MTPFETRPQLAENRGKGYELIGQQCCPIALTLPEFAPVGKHLSGENIDRCMIVHGNGLILLIFSTGLEDLRQIMRFPDIG